jgi:glycosyltransferase involved in cell wall biosynthesis
MGEDVAESSEHTPRVSVVIPAYNEEEFLERCVRSVMAQTYQDWECIVVDDGSTDDTPRIADALAAEDPRVRVIHQANRGFSGSRNAGMFASRGEFLVFIDCDDYIEPTMFDVCVSAMDEKGVNLVVGSFIWEIYDGSKENIVSTSHSGPQEDFLFNVRDMDKAAPKLWVMGEYGGCLHYCVWDRMFRKSVILDHAMRFDETMTFFEDCKFIYEFYLYGGDILVSNQLFYHYTRNVGKDDVADKKALDMFRSDEKSMIPLIEAKCIYHFPDDYHKAMIDRIMRLYLYFSSKVFLDSTGLPEEEQRDYMRQITEEFSFHYFIDLFADDDPFWKDMRDKLLAGDQDGIYEEWKAKALSNVWVSGK